MVVCMRNKEKEKKFGYNNHPLIVINLTRTDVITVRGFDCTCKTKDIPISLSCSVCCTNLQMLACEHIKHQHVSIAIVSI